MTSTSLRRSCSPTSPSPPPPPPPLPPPNPPPPLAPVAEIVQQEMPTSSSSSIQQHQQLPQQRLHHHDIVMDGSVTPPALPSTSTQQHNQQSPGASTTTSTPSSTSSAKGAGSSGSATTATTGPATTTGTTGTTTTATRNKRQELSFAERIQVIEARTSGKSMRQLALQFGCGKTQILNILGQREAYLKEWDEKQAELNPHISARKRRSRRTGNEETNQKVWDWYTRQKNMGIRVTGPMLQREARSIARNLNIPNFAASNGWLDSFRRLHNIGPQNKTMSDRRSGNPSTSAAAGGQSSTTPEPRPGYGSTMLVVPTSSSNEFPGSSFTIQHPTSSKDGALSPSSSVTSQRPPPPLEVFSYPLHPTGYPTSSGYYQQHRNQEEDEEEDDEEEDESRRSNEDGEFVPSRHSIQTFHSQRNPGAIHHPETEFGRSFALITNFHDSSNSVGGPSTHHSVSPSPYHPAQSSQSMDASDFHLHRSSDPYERMQHHSSSSSNSLAFSPTDVYSPSRHPSGQHQASIGGHRINNNGSRSTDLFHHMDGHGASSNLTSPVFQQVSKNLFEHDFTPTPTFQSHESTRSIIQDGRARGNGGGAMGGNAALQQQPQLRRTSVLTSTHAVTAAAAAAAAASLENQHLQQQQLQQQLTNDERVRSSSAPGLELFPPGLFGALLSMVRSCGLSCLEYADDRGDIWLEIKPPSFATFRVPAFGYRTHLMRLLVDRHLNYWFEVLGHCVRSGTFRSLTSGGIDPSLVKPLLDSLNGGATVCHGRGSVLKRVHQFHPKDALLQGLAGQNYFTLPDYRYRSYDCARLIDAKTGATQCFACLQPYEPSRSESPPDGIHASSVIRLQQQQSRDGSLPPSTTSKQQEEQHNRQQQQQQQQHNLPSNEPLNLSVHHPLMEDVITVSPERKKSGFSSISPDGFPNRNNIFTGPRVLLASPSVIAQQSPQLQLAIQQPSKEIQNHHHHYYHCHHHSGEKPTVIDQNPEDYRLAKEASFLSLTNDRPSTRDRNRCHVNDSDWEHISNTNSENLSSKFGSGSEVDMRSDDPEFHNEWIKQEMLDSSNNVATFK